jgi:pimeloyl-ACP methyl ester carboxylesterase
MEPLMRLLARHCTAIAVDTPGFGQSDALPEKVWSMAALSDLMLAFMNQLGLETVGVCGQHTGAAMAAELARRHPSRVLALALDGIPLFNAQECQTILPHQLYRFVPAADGSHLTWAWSRFRDGWMFFPWSERHLSNRRDVDMPNADTLHRSQIMELLRSRESHLHIYPGVFTWDGNAALAALTQPAWLGTTADDQLFPHLERIPAGDPRQEIHRLPHQDREALRMAQADWMSSQLEAASAPAAPANPKMDGLPTSDGRWRAYVAGRCLSAERWDTNKLITVVLHGAGSAARCELERCRTLIAGPLCAIDLPGHGDDTGDLMSPTATAQALQTVIESLNVPSYRLWGRGLGAAVALEWAADARARERPLPEALTVCELKLWTESERSIWPSQYTLPLTPDWDGSYLIRLWHQIRDRELFHPWFERTRATIRPVEPQLDADLLTLEVFAALCCRDWAGSHRSWLNWRADALDAIGSADVTFLATPGDGWARDVPALQALVAPRAKR